MPTPSSFLFVTDKVSRKEGLKSKERLDTLFSHTNMFDNLHVEGQIDGDLTRSSSPDLNNGGVPLGGNEPAREPTLLDSDIDDDFRASFNKSGLLKLQLAEFASSSNELPSKSVPGGLSRYYYAAKLNGYALPGRPGDEPKENPWIPHLNSSFWNIYDNRLRVYGTETEVFHLGA